MPMKSETKARKEVALKTENARLRQLVNPHTEARRERVRQFDVVFVQFEKKTPEFAAALQKAEAKEVRA